MLLLTAAACAQFEELISVPEQSTHQAATTQTVHDMSRLTTDDAQRVESCEQLILLSDDHRSSQVGTALPSRSATEQAPQVSFDANTWVLYIYV